jgi:hypothetical protein
MCFFNRRNVITQYRGLLSGNQAGGAFLRVAHYLIEPVAGFRHGRSIRLRQATVKPQLGAYAVNLRSLFINHRNGLTCST